MWARRSKSDFARSPPMSWGGVVRAGWGDGAGEEEEESDDAPGAGAFFLVIVQIIVIDMVFSLDSIITAIGMAQDLEIMIAAVVIACLVMYVSSGPVARFVAEHPTTKMLALAFLVL